MNKFKGVFLVMSLVALLLASCNKEKSDYQVTVTMPAEIQVDSLYLVNYEGEKMQGAAPNAEKQFVFKGKAKEIVPAGILHEKSNLYIPFILENDDITINVKDKQKTTDIKGGKIHELVYKYENNPEYQKLDAERKELMKKHFTNLDMNDEAKVEEARKIVNTVADKMFKIKNASLKEVMEGNNPAIAKAIAATMYSDREYTADKMLANLEKYKKETGENGYITYYEKMMKEYQQMEENAKNASVGNKYMDISGKDRDGNVIKLSDLVAKNKYTILEFWASWCGPCRGEIPNLKAAYGKYKDKGLEIYSVSLDSKEAAWLKAMDEEKQNWPNVLVEGEFRNPEVAKYGIVGIPASYLIDQNGTIVASNDELREFALDRTLSQHLK
ncbi:AhpC/TSA family protein [Chryseobacterium salipaludis]|uniref:TlpA disulfide reductase family protein n=1 Tax=Chryseobacterium TaxID=59732 RepID=UPI001FF6AE7E|nr:MULTISPECIES: TlpA disulfide reductase family protein [Chryseobacterium]MCJ8496995.1 AhpC/TSA family protein [Chryseobacterium salipaludis]MCX3296476.1 TlpA disulfide reductase family protein [Planobacterium sp. JC490]